jgi:hypothetical protein
MEWQVIGKSSDPCNQREEGTTVGADQSLLSITQLLPTGENQFSKEEK